MGFGLLLIGYTIANIFTLTSYSFVGMLVGYFIIFCALCELRKYCPTFIYSLFFSVALILCSFFECFAGLDGLFAWGIIQEGATITQVFVIVEFALTCLFNLALLFGIADIAKRVDLPDVREKAFRNMIFVGIFNVYQLFLFLPLDFVEQEKPFLMTLLMVLSLAYSIINLVLFFRCYAFICPQGDEDMPIKPSRFEFINKMRAKSEAKEQEAIEYYQQRAEDIKKRRENKRKKKKK